MGRFTLPVSSMKTSSTRFCTSRSITVPSLYSMLMMPSERKVISASLIVMVLSLIRGWAAISRANVKKIIGQNLHPLQITNKIDQCLSSINSPGKQAPFPARTGNHNSIPQYNNSDPESNNKHIVHLLYISFPGVEAVFQCFLLPGNTYCRYLQ